MSVTYSESVFVALDIQHSLCMGHFVICGLPALQYFSALYHKLHDIKEKVIKHKLCVLFFSTTFFLKHFSF